MNMSDNYDIGMNRNPQKMRFRVFWGHFEQTWGNRNR